ncbi:NOL1/NOP2/sun family protein [gut metagenome]|uniref:NOL1/NOP2/sun family protein n=1 Tax=gut metagenome TaxID=749906 RepID=J9CGU6_9ZZZZ
MLAPGGLLMYSTCTFAPQEDETQAAKLLANHPEIELLPLDVPFGSPGEANRCGGFALDVSRVRRIWPNQGGEGHFMALFKKSEESKAPHHAKKKRVSTEKQTGCRLESFSKELFSGSCRALDP